ncbi:MAG: DUF5320 family protein [Dethiosulfovibrio sp.]|nr:DUF5320 family protein [Dethiosulfovibrio sp.]
MAGRDKTGPLGTGPGTGRGLGGCVTGTFVRGRGRGRGCGLGFDNSLLNRIALLEEKIDALLGAKKED